MTGESNTWILAVQKLMAFYVLASYIIMAFASWKLPDYHLERSIHIVFTLIDIKNRILLIAVNAILFFSTVFLKLLSVITIRKSSQLKHKLYYFVILVQSVLSMELDQLLFISLN